MPSPAHSYFVTINGEKHGPYRAQQIHSKLAQGKLSETDFIWRDGMADWRPIASMIDEFPGAAPPPIPDEAITRITKLTITHPNDFPTTVLNMPEKGVYEPPATRKQKNLLMKLGCKEPELLRILGREQASFMIDAFFKDKDDAVQFELNKLSREREKSTVREPFTLTMLAIILIGIGIGAILFHLFLW